MTNLITFFSFFPNYYLAGFSFLPVTISDSAAPFTLVTRHLIPGINSFYIREKKYDN